MAAITSLPSLEYRCGNTVDTLSVFTNVCSITPSPDLLRDALSSTIRVRNGLLCVWPEDSVFEVVFRSSTGLYAATTYQWQLSAKRLLSPKD